MLMIIEVREAKLLKSYEHGHVHGERLVIKH